MGYLSDIVKQLKEEQDIIFVGTGMLLINEHNEVFIACRTDNNQWCVPGGSLEVGELLTHCVVRETLEETGIQVNESDITLNTVEAIPEIIVKNNRNIHIVSVSYWTKAYNDIDFNLDSREFTKYGWFSREEVIRLMDDITPYTQVALRKYYNITHC